MNTPVRVGETIEGSRTMRNRPYQVLKCSKVRNKKEFKEKTAGPPTIFADATSVRSHDMRYEGLAGAGVDRSRVRTILGRRRLLSPLLVRLGGATPIRSLR